MAPQNAEPNENTANQDIEEKNQKPVDADLDVIISDDQQSAYAGIRAPQGGGRDLNAAEIIDLLKKKRVTYGFLEEEVQKMADHPEYGKMVLVAKGEPAQEGTDAKLDYHVVLSHELKPKERDDGSVDYHDLGLITSVKAGDALCTLTPSVKGTPGHTVTGRVLLPPPVRNLGLPLGKNTTLSEDKLTLISQINGCLDWQNGRLNVLNLFRVKGNVDITTGNIDFDGSVMVMGDITSGFTVKATGRIDVMGHVEAATIESGSDMKLMGGFAGQGRGIARCGGSFRALFIENAEVEARGDVTADVVMHSRVQCGGSLIAEGRHGAVLGGYIVVARDVKALVIGTPNAVATVLELGTDPGRVDRMKTIDTRLRALEGEQKKLGQIIQMLTPMMQAGKLAPGRADMLNKAIATHGANESEQSGLQEEREKLRQEIEMFSGSQVVCRKELYAGTKITISSVVYNVTDDLVRCKVYLNPQREVSMVSI